LPGGLTISCWLSPGSLDVATAGLSATDVAGTALIAAGAIAILVITVTVAVSSRRARRGSGGPRHGGEAARHRNRAAHARRSGHRARPPTRSPGAEPGPFRRRSAAGPLDRQETAPANRPGGAGAVSASRPGQQSIALTAPVTGELVAPDQAAMIWQASEEAAAALEAAQQEAAQLRTDLAAMASQLSDLSAYVAQNLVDLTAGPSQPDATAAKHAAPEPPMTADRLA
jgi:hypothetical protein